MEVKMEDLEQQGRFREISKFKSVQLWESSDN